MRPLEKPKLLHIISAFDLGGTELGILRMIEGGFYDRFDVHVVALRKGTGLCLERFEKALGPGKTRFLLDEPKKHVRGFFFLASYALRREFRRENPDAIILSGYNNIFFSGSAIPRTSRAALVGFEHRAQYYTAARSRLGRIMLRLGLPRVDAFFADCAATIAATAHKYAHGAQGFEVPLIRVTPAVPAAYGTPDVVDIASLGRFSHEKNYGALVEAAALLKSKGYAFRLTLAGAGRQEAMLREMVAKHGLEQHVFFPGFVDDAGRDALLEKAHIYVQPSLIEGQCLAFVEAMAAGKLVVGTKVGGMLAHGVDGQNIFHAEGFGAEHLATAMERAIVHLPHSLPMRQAAVAEMTAHYGPEAIDRKWAAAAHGIHSIIAARRSATPVWRRCLGLAAARS